MEKKEYERPRTKVVKISPAALLSTSSLKMFNYNDTNDLDEEYYQW